MSFLVKSVHALLLEPDALVRKIDELAEAIGTGAGSLISKERAVDSFGPLLASVGLAFWVERFSEIPLKDYPGRLEALQRNGAFVGVGADPRHFLATKRHDWHVFCCGDSTENRALLLDSLLVDGALWVDWQLLERAAVLTDSGFWCVEGKRT